MGFYNEGFYRGEKLGKTYDLTGIISKRRNELISGVLVACNVMEAAGTGFDKIAEEYSQVEAGAWESGSQWIPGEEQGVQSHVL